MSQPQCEKKAYSNVQTYKQRKLDAQTKKIIKHTEYNQ